MWTTCKPCKEPGPWRDHSPRIPKSRIPKGRIPKAGIPRCRIPELEFQGLEFQNQVGELEFQLWRRPAVTMSMRRPAILIYSCMNAMVSYVYSRRRRVYVTSPSKLYSLLRNRGSTCVIKWRLRVLMLMSPKHKSLYECHEKQPTSKI